MTKKRIGILSIIGLICIGLAGMWYMTTEDELSDFVGNWKEIEIYQYGEVISAKPSALSTFCLEITEDGRWTITDSFDKPPEVTSGKLEEYEGAYCLYYGDDFRYVLSRNGSRLEADAQYLKGEYTETKLVFEK